MRIRQRGIGQIISQKRRGMLGCQRRPAKEASMSITGGRGVSGSRGRAVGAGQLCRRPGAGFRWGRGPCWCRRCALGSGRPAGCHDVVIPAHHEPTAPRPSPRFAPCCRWILGLDPRKSLSWPCCLLCRQPTAPALFSCRHTNRSCWACSVRHSLMYVLLRTSSVSTWVSFCIGLVGPEPYQ